MVVYYHGGGWVIGSLDVYEPSAKALAEKTGAIVVNVDYRLAPEAKFPAAHKWTRDNAASFGGNPAKVAVAGSTCFTPALPTSFSVPTMWCPRPARPRILRPPDSKRRSNKRLS